MERLFIAAWPDAATVEALAALPRPDEEGVRWVPAAQWHVTMRFLGDCAPAGLIERLERAELRGCVARLGPAVDWLGRQLVIPVSGTDHLAAAVVAATADLGEPPRSPFRGHLTVARTRRGATSELVGHPCSASFRVAELALVHSELSPDGPRYTEVSRCRLG